MLFLRIDVRLNQLHIFDFLTSNDVDFYHWYLLLI